MAVEVLLVIPWLLAAMFTSQVGQLLFKFSLKTKTILYCLIRLLNIYVLCTTFIFEVITSYNCLSLPWLKHSTSGIPSLYFYVTYLVLTGFPPETSLHGFLLVLWLPQGLQVKHTVMIIWGQALHLGESLEYLLLFPGLPHSVYFFPNMKWRYFYFHLSFLCIQLNRNLNVTKYFK